MAASTTKGVVQLPNETIYCHNLNDKINPTTRKQLLYELFVPYGRILDIIVKAPSSTQSSGVTQPSKRPGGILRGQAFIIFNDVASATNAMRCVQGRNVLGKVLHISFAKDKSNMILARYPNPPSKKATKKIEKAASKKASEASLNKEPVVDVEGSDVPNRCIFVTKLPSIMTQDALKALFEQFEGFMEARLVSAKGVGFVDFSTVGNAQSALQALQGFRVTPENPIKLFYSK